jgi:hypothetical protein
MPGFPYRLALNASAMDELTELWLDGSPEERAAITTSWHEIEESPS